MESEVQSTFLCLLVAFKPILNLNVFLIFSTSGPYQFTLLLFISGNGNEGAELWTSPIVREWFYELLLLGISIGNKTVDLSCRKFNTDKTILDSGTTSLMLPTEV